MMGAVGGDGRAWEGVGVVWEGVGVVGAVGGRGSSVGGRGSGGSGGRAWEIAPEPPKGDKLQVEGQVIGKR